MDVSRLVLREHAAVIGVALYLRVSTEDQDLAGQERELRAYAESRGWSVTAVFAEKASASGRIEREAWEELQREACFPTTRRFDRVLVWALDRWSREPSFVRAVGSIERLEILGIRWHSLKEPQLDSGEDASPNLARDLLRGILPTIAAFESRRRSERTRLAMQQIKSGRRRTRTGRPPGRPRKVQPQHERRILELRDTLKPNGQRRKWSEIALSVQLPAGTCRKVYAALRSKKPRVEKGQDGFLPLGGGE